MSQRLAALERGSASAGFIPRAAHEQAARSNQNAMLAGARLPSLSRHTVKPLDAAAPGAKLADAHRARMESRLGGDFSGVRVHTGSVEAEALGADAFTHGNEIAFAPGKFAPHTNTGQALLAHELTHVSQQAEAGQPAVQMQPRNEQGGLGNAPPKEPFITSDVKGDEDSFALFRQNEADVPSAAIKSLEALLAVHKGPVTVTIHGYASSEGDANYNVNLSAHRAAALKAAIASKLPPGSKVVLFANGETTAFGPLEDNRRAGVSILDGVASSESDARKKAESQAAPALQRAAADFLPKPSLTLSPEFELPPRPPHLPALTLTPEFKDIDWESIHSKVAARGRLLEDRDIAAITSHFYYSYNFINFFVGHKKALWGANLATTFVVDNWIGAEAPNAWDRATIDFSRHFPDEKHLVFQIVSSDILDGIVQYIKGTDKPVYTFRFGR